MPTDKATRTSVVIVVIAGGEGEKHIFVRTYVVVSAAWYGFSKPFLVSCFYLRQPADIHSPKSS